MTIPPQQDIRHDWHDAGAPPHDEPCDEPRERAGIHLDPLPTWTPKAAPARPHEAWGTHAIRARFPEAYRRLARAVAVARPPWDRLGPLLVVAVALLALGYVHYVKQDFAQGPGLAGFAEINRVDAAKIGLSHLAVGSDVGYDGQFFFELAYRPALVVDCAHSTLHCPTYDPVFRWQRVLYPAAAWLAAFGQAALLPVALLLVNLLTILATVSLVGSLAVAAGASRWLGAAAGLFCGEAMSFLRDLSDPFGILWIVAAIYLFRKGRPLWAAAAVAAALLTREGYILYVPLLALPLVAARRWSILARAAAIALGPFLAWQVALRALYGQWPLIAGDTRIATLVHVPFLGLWRASGGYDFALTVLCAAVPLVFAIAICLTGLIALWRDGPRSLLRDPVPLFALLYCVLFAFVNYPQWADLWGASRLAAPGIVLALLVVAKLRSSALRASYGTLLALTVLAPLVEIWH